MLEELKMSQSSNLVSELTLMPQEQENTYQFNGQLYITRGFESEFGDIAHALAFLAVNRIINEIVKVKGGADYLQVFECNGKRFWAIDDVDHITILLPSEY
jgi:hypothetical protein